MYKSVKKTKLLTAVIVAVIVIFLVILVGFPLAWMALSSFKPGVELFTMKMLSTIFSIAYI